MQSQSVATTRPNEDSPPRKVTSAGIVIEVVRMEMWKVK